MQSCGTRSCFFTRLFLDSTRGVRVPLILVMVKTPCVSGLPGQTEPELPEARRSHAGAQTVDGHPWIWRRMRQQVSRRDWSDEINHVQPLVDRVCFSVLFDWQV